jgi:hypothetical protein
MDRGKSTDHSQHCRARIGDFLSWTTRSKREFLTTPHRPDEVLTRCRARSPDRVKSFICLTSRESSKPDNVASRQSRIGRYSEIVRTNAAHSRANARPEKRRHTRAALPARASAGKWVRKTCFGTTFSTVPRPKQGQNPIRFLPKTYSRRARQVGNCSQTCYCTVAQILIARADTHGFHLPDFRSFNII